MIALTNLPSPNMQACELTFVPHLPIDVSLALAQHAAYCQALADSGSELRTLNVNSLFPDCAFIEDTAIVLDEVAILASMGAATRQAEPARIEPILREYREVVRIELPATLEGGDVLRIGRRLLVGQSCRTNVAGIAALHDIAARYGYQVTPIPIQSCLHLKTACAALPDGRLLVNPDWADVRSLTRFDWIRVPANEPWGANVCLPGRGVLLPAVHTQTAESISKFGFEVKQVDFSEFAKAEGGVTCLSLLFD